MEEHYPYLLAADPETGLVTIHVWPERLTHTVDKSLVKKHYEEGQQGIDATVEIVRQVILANGYRIDYIVWDHDANDVVCVCDIKKHI